MSAKMIERKRLEELMRDAYEETREIRQWPALAPEGEDAERRGMAETAVSRLDTMPMDVISRLDAENARLQRVVDDLADRLRDANRVAETYGMKKLPERIRGTLDKHGLLRPADRPECVPESMRAGAED